MPREVARIIAQLRDKAADLQRESASYAAQAKKTYEEAAAIMRALDSLEALPANVRSEGEPDTDIKRVTSRTFDAADRLAGYLRESVSAKCSVILKELGMTYGTQERMTQAFPEAFQLRDEDGNKVVALLSLEALRAARARYEAIV